MVTATPAYTMLVWNNTRALSDASCGISAAWAAAICWRADMLLGALGSAIDAGAASSIITARRPFAFARRGGGFSPADAYEIGCGGLVGSANEAAGNSAAMSMTPSNVSRVEIRRLIVLPLNH